jgi:uncharacterized coiled-coil protein SlyX
MSESDRLQSLEMAVAHAEAAIDDLSRVVRDQDGELAALRLELRRLGARLDRFEEGGGHGFETCDP